MNVPGIRLTALILMVTLWRGHDLHVNNEETEVNNLIKVTAIQVKE